MERTTDKILNKVLTALKLPTVKEKNKSVVKEKAKESLLAKLQINKEFLKKDGDSDKKSNKRIWNANRHLLFSLEMSGAFSMGGLIYECI